MAINLIWKHQQKTYQMMKEALKRNKRAAYIFPTGCGKTFPALKYIEENPDKNVLIVSPSIGINNQFEKYIKQYIENGDERLKNKNISIISYQKLSLLLKRAHGIKPDIVILDELHRAGAETWEPAVDDLIQQNPNLEVIGMTATPERTDERNMAYEKFNDDVVYEMSLTEALSGEKEGEVVLKTPRYIRVLSELKKLAEQYKDRMDLIEDPIKKERFKRKFQKLETLISNSPDIPDIMAQGMQKKNGKYIVYCKDRDDLQEKMENAQRIFGKVNSKINVQYIFSKNNALNDDFGKTNSQNRKTIEEFENKENGDELNLLFCVDKLNEGVHIEGVDGEVLFDLTSSPILYKQRIGRVLSSDKNAGETVIIDAANNWLNQLDVYNELVEAVRRGGKGNNIDYDSLKLTPEETELIDVLREIGEEFKYNSNRAYEEIIYWLDTHNGIMPRSDIKYNDVRMKPSELTPEERAEVNLYQRWNNSAEFVALKQYEGVKLDDIPEEYRGKIAKLREYGYGLTSYETFITWIEKHDGKIPQTMFVRNGKKVGLTTKEMTKEEHDEKIAHDKWMVSKERKVLEKYAGRPIEEVPEEFREKIERLRSFGLGAKVKTVYEKFIEWLETHDGKIPRQLFPRNGKIVRLTKKEMTKEELEEKNLRATWEICKEKKILDQYAGRPIEEVPEEFREKIEKLRSFGMGMPKVSKNICELMVQWLEEHDGKRPRADINDLKRGELSEEQKREVKLADAWNRSKEKELLEQYIGIDIEDIPEEHRKTIEMLRKGGLGLEAKTTYEQIIEWLESHNGQMPQRASKKGKQKIDSKDLTSEERKERNLRKRWEYSNEYKILNEYAGRPIEEVPEEFRDKIAKLRSLGQLGRKRDNSIKNRMKNAVSKNVGNNQTTRDELHAELEKEMDESEQE